MTHRNQDRTLHSIKQRHALLNLGTVCISVVCVQMDSHADGVNFNEFIAAMFDAQGLAKAEVAKLVSGAGSIRGSIDGPHL